jgi:CDP-paratose 2-epimerase
MNILITGGAGFIGANAAITLKERGHDVVVMDNDLHFRNKLRVIMLKSAGVKVEHGDVRNTHALNRAVKIAFEGKLDYIIHCAAQTAMTTSLENPRIDFDINAKGTLNVCLFAQKKKAGIIYCSTNKVYGNKANYMTLVEGQTRWKYANDKLCIDEEFTIDNTLHTPYGVSKLVGDLLVQDHWNLHGLPAYTLRLSCIYGTDQSGTVDQGWVSFLAKQWVNREKITIFGDGKQVRDILYVQDLSNLMARIIEGEQETCGVYNIGGGLDNTVSILELLAMFNEIDPWDSPNIENGEWRVGDQKIYISNYSKARRYLKFEPSIKMKDGIKRLIAYHKLMKGGALF